MKTMAYTSSRAFAWLKAKLHTFSNWALNAQLKKTQQKTHQKTNPQKYRGLYLSYNISFGNIWNVGFKPLQASSDILQSGAALMQMCE